MTKEDSAWKVDTYLNRKSDRASPFRPECFPLLLIRLGDQGAVPLGAKHPAVVGALQPPGLMDAPFGQRCEPVGATVKMALPSV